MTALPDDLERLIAEEPFVRRLARHLVAGEVEDIVQATWVRVLETRPRLLQEPRQWLASVVRHLVADRRRGDRRREQRERVVAPTAVPSPDELIAVEETRRELILMVNTLPEAMRTVVLLRFYDGLPPRRIAAQLGVTVSAVSNRLHDAVRELRRRLRARHPGCRAWLTALAPLANNPCELPWRELAAPPAAATCLGMMAMTTKTKTVAALAAMLLLLTIVGWPAIRDAVAPPVPQAEHAMPATSALAMNAPEPAQPTPEAAQREPAATAAASAATTGSLVVHVHYGDEPSVAPGVAVIAHTGGWGRGVKPCAVTDATGTARFDGLPPGRASVHTPAQPRTAAFPTIVAGREIECVLELVGGMTVSGIVVEPSGVPVSGAILEMTLPQYGTTLASPGVTAVDGTFTLRQCNTECLIGARAPGFAAPKMCLVRGKAGATEYVRIELLPDGGCVAGRVLGADGSPVANAVVRVGDGRTEALPADDSRRKPAPAQVGTDADGRFFAVGVPAGQQPVQARAAGLAPWLGSVDVAAAGTVHVSISLVAGFTCRGFLKDEKGAPLPKVRVEMMGGDFARVAAESGADGSYVLAGIPAGRARLTAAHRAHGSGSVDVDGAAGQVIACDVVLSKGIVVRGRVVDDLGAPVAKVQVDFEAPDVRGWGQVAFTDADGRFAANNCPFDQMLVARITTREHVPFVQTSISARSDEVVLTLVRDTAPRARIVGRVLRADGKPAGGEGVSAGCTDARRFTEECTVGSDGEFVIEVAAGTWMFGTAVKAHASFRSEPRRLDPGATWNAGTIQLDRGGTVRVDVGKGPALEHRIVTPQCRHVADLIEAPHRSGLLNAGEYLLLVRGESVAAQAIPFTIVSGEETVVDVKRADGVRQRFTYAGGADAKARIRSFEVRADGNLITAHADAPEVLWLARGSYLLHVRTDDATATVPFTVPATEGPPVRVVAQ